MKIKWKRAVSIILVMTLMVTFAQWKVYADEEKETTEIVENNLDCGPDFPNSGTAAATKPAGKPCRPLRRKPAAGTPARAVPFFFSVTPRPPSVPPPATCSF